MRHLSSEFHFRHALFALQGPDGYVDALMETARAAAPRSAATSFRRQRGRAGAPTDQADGRAPTRSR
jgi:hypothetical protein